MFRPDIAFATILWADAAAAEPVTFTILGSVLVFDIAAIAVSLGLSIALSLVASALVPKPKTPEQKRDLQAPRSRPPKRFVYGRNRMYGSPVPWRVKGHILYGCLILNSRPSAGGTIQIAMDKRDCTITTGSIHDFSGNGAVLGDIEDFPVFTNSTDLQNPRVWIGLGDQTTPPSVFVTEAPEFFQSTDGWRDCTVMWVRLAIGENSRRSDRWRAVPPEFEVEMDWSLVYDPRDTDQDPDDPDTWVFSNNQALVLLDALRQNPFRQYPLSQIHMPSFVEAADVADEQVKKYYASIDAGEDVFESRYTANGLIVWNTNELVEQIEPIVSAGAGDLVRIGGKLGYAAGEYRAPLLTITDIVEDGGIDYQVLRPGREVPAAVLCAYIAPERDWQEAELKQLAVTGASTASGESGVYEMTLSFVTSATQAMRIQQIMARKLAAQRTLGVTLWPEALDVVGGATLDFDLPAGFERLNGEWMVTSANPAVWLSEITDDGEQNLALRVPVTLRQTSESIYQWVPATDEQEILDVAFSPVRQAPGAPQNMTATSGAGISTEDSARIRVDFDAVSSVDVYEIELRQQGQAYARVLTTTANANILLPAVSGITYDVRVRGVKRSFVTTQEGSFTREQFTPYAEITDVLAQPATQTLPLPTNGSATGGANQIAVTFTAPNSPFYSGMQFWGSDTDDVDAASILDTLFGAAGETKTYTETGLGNNVTRYYFARAVGPQGRASDFTASVTATTDP